MSILYAFLVGGGFCVLAQILIDKTNMTPARILVLYAVGGGVLGAVGLFKPLLAFAGCGASVPLVGFGGAIADGVYKAISGAEGVLDGLIAVFVAPLSSAAGGIAAALTLGYLCAVVFKSHPKRG